MLSHRILKEMSRAASNCLIRRATLNFHRQTFATCEEMVMENTINDCSTAKQVITVNLPFRPSRGNTLYLLNEDEAKKFVTAITLNRTSTNASCILEINPGLGLVTENLMKIGAPSIRMFEGIQEFHPRLIRLTQKYSKQLVLNKIDFYQLWSIAYGDSKDNTNKFDKYFDNVEKRAWEDEPVFEIIGSLSAVNLIQRLIKCVIYQNGIAKYGRMVLYVTMPPSVWSQLNATNEHYAMYKTFAILFQLLFRSELLGQLSRSAFAPKYMTPKKSRIKCYRNIQKDDHTLMNMVKIELKRDIFNENFTASDIIPFYCFIKHQMRSKKSKIIPSLEKWIPGFGRNLVIKGYNIFTEFGELTPQELFDLFIDFKSWPTYKKSTFMSYISTSLMQMDESIIFDEISENTDDLF